MKIDYTKIISIHAPSRERPRTITVVVHGQQFQSTLPRGSDSVHFEPPSVHFISIHAPSRERPISREHELCFLTISIHAPSRERPYIAAYRPTSRQFQSTLPRGSDQVHALRENPALGISIHAPSRERPGNAEKLIFNRTISIHAPSRERPASNSLRLTSLTFQSTLPRGSDR